MGQKVDPRGIRLGITRTWDSKWFAEGKEYVTNFHEDLKIKKYIKKNYYHAGISSIQIERTSPTEVAVIIETGKDVILIGRKGQEIEALKVKLEKLTGKRVQIKVQEAIQRAEKAGIKGIKVMVSGRLNGAEIARSEWTLSGRVPLHTLRADVDYATATAHTTYGALGLKVWIFNGEVLSTTKEGENE